jgi:hypothetical protein
MKVSKSCKQRGSFSLREHFLVFSRLTRSLLARMGNLPGFDLFAANAGGMFPFRHNRIARNFHE